MHCGAAPWPAYISLQRVQTLVHAAGALNASQEAGPHPGPVDEGSSPRDAHETYRAAKALGVAAAAVLEAAPPGVNYSLRAVALLHSALARGGAGCGIVTLLLLLAVLDVPAVCQARDGPLSRLQALFVSGHSALLVACPMGLRGAPEPAKSQSSVAIILSAGLAVPTQTATAIPAPVHTGCEILCSPCSCNNFSGHACSGGDAGRAERGAGRAPAAAVSSRSERGRRRAALRPATLRGHLWVHNASAGTVLVCQPADVSVMYIPYRPRQVQYTSSSMRLYNTLSKLK